MQGLSPYHIICNTERKQEYTLLGNTSSLDSHEKNNQPSKINGKSFTSKDMISIRKFTYSLIFNQIIHSIKKLSVTPFVSCLLLMA